MAASPGREPHSMLPAQVWHCGFLQAHTGLQQSQLRSQWAVELSQALPCTCPLACCSRASVPTVHAIRIIFKNQQQLKVKERQFFNIKMKVIPRAEKGSASLKTRR